MEKMIFKTGEFRSFTATRSFALGAFNVTVAKDATLEFDGSMVDYAGQRYTFPQLRGAITAKWLVLSENFDENDPEYNRPISANIKVRSATSDDKTRKEIVTEVETDERIVASTVQHAESTKERNKRKTIAKLIESVSVDQEGVPVRSLKTSAKAKSELTASSVGTLLREASNVQIEPGKGISEAEMLEKMSEDAKQEYLTKKSFLKAQYVDSDSVEVAKIKGKKSVETEGIKLTQKVGGGIEIADLSGSTKPSKKTTIVEDGITFQNTNGPEKLQPQQHPRSVNEQLVMFKDGTVEARLKIAKSLCPEFPGSYDFAASSKKKLARLQADFEDRPDVIRAVFAAESDDFKSKLIEEFPNAFR